MIVNSLKIRLFSDFFYRWKIFSSSLAKFLLRFLFRKRKKTKFFHFDFHSEFDGLNYKLYNAKNKK